jgi:hypothetical protein
VTTGVQKWLRTETRVSLRGTVEFTNTTSVILQIEMEKHDMQQITEFTKDLLDRWKARQEQMAALREEREADTNAWEERVAAIRKPD